MFIDVNGVRLYYEIHGSGQPLVMVHCHRRTHAIFSEAVKVLEKHFTVYNIDSRGHGKSTAVRELHYEDMAEDIYCFIERLGIKKPVFYGFSDGGIIGLILASKHPDLLSKLIVSGASTQPSGIKTPILNFYKARNLIDFSGKTRLMLREPNITDDMLRQIKAPTYVTCGTRDLIKLSHTQHIADTIPNARLDVFRGETHGSYIKGSRKIADYILSVCE